MDTPIRHVHHVPAEPEEVWHAFLNEKNLEKWLKADSRKGMRAREGYEFLWILDGQRFAGRIAELDHHQKIVFEWRFDDPDIEDRWPEGHFSIVQLELGDMNKSTRIDLFITNIPDTEQDELRRLWQQVILLRLEAFFKGNPELEKSFE